MLIRATLILSDLEGETCFQFRVRERESDATAIVESGVLLIVFMTLTYRSNIHDTVLRGRFIPDVNMASQQLATPLAEVEERECTNNW